jgi:hypothetical protein
MKTTPTKPTLRHARKIIELLSFGLIKGKGIPEPGKMCVEAAVCYAMGMPHGDQPKCVGSAVRAFKIALNDCEWPSNKARATGMRQLAIAQLGSDNLDQMAFGKLNYLRGVQKVLPFIWRKESEKITNANRKAEMLALVERMEAVVTFGDAGAVAKDASAYASAYADAYADADAYAYAYTYACACADAHAHAYAYAYAYTYADASYRHELLLLIANIGVDVLIELKSPGCKWLYLCK